MEETRVLEDPFRSLRGLWVLLRFVPVLTWSMSALLLGAAAAWAAGHGDWFHLILMYVGAILVQGFVTHAYNDIADWRSGTDPASPRIMSGGSHVVPRGYFSLRDLGAIGGLSLILALAIGLYFTLTVGPGVAVVVAVGLFAAVFYTTPPLALGYRPFVGEWLTALPALVALPVGAYYILARTVAPVVVLVGVVHGILCIGRLMNHHIPDMEADAAASPRKVTSVVWVRERFGVRFVPWLGASYFIIAAAVAALGALILSPALLISTPVALVCAALAATARPSDVAQVTRREVAITIAIVVGAVALALTLYLWR